MKETIESLNAINKKPRNPWLFIPSQYFAEGIPFVLVNQLSAALYQSLGVSNLFIGMTSFLYIPWSIKFLWSPFVDAWSSKRNWVVSLQLMLGIVFILTGLFMNTPFFLIASLVFFTATAFISATHDIATDGFYLHSLDKKDQAFFTGIRNTFYRVAMIFAGGFLIAFAGKIGDLTGNISFGWTLSFLISGILFILLSFYHRRILPYPETDKVHNAGDPVPYKKIFAEYFSQEKIGVIIAFILLYRFGEALLLKMVQPFFLDKPEAGGLGLTLSHVGIMYGTFGVLALITGGILGGWLIKKYTLKKLIWPFVLTMHLPNLLFVYLALFKPDSNLIVQSVIILEQFGYGLGFSAFMVYLLYTSKGEYKTSHYAISTGIMAIGMMLPGFLSGIIQSYFGYFGLFITSCFATLPGMAMIFFLPFDDDVKKS